MSKGDTYRKVDYARYASNWDVIDWGKPRVHPVENKEPIAPKAGVVTDPRVTRVLEEDKRTEIIDNGQFGVGA